MFDSILTALNKRDADLETRQNYLLDELDAVKAERSAIAAQVRLIEKLDVEFLAPFACPPVLTVPGPISEEAHHALLQSIRENESKPGRLQLLEVSPPGDFQRVARVPESVRRAEDSPEPEGTIPTEEPELDPVAAEEEAAADETVRRLERAVAETSAKPAVSRGEAIRPKLIAYLLKAADGAGNVLVDEAMISKKLDAHIITIKAAVDILVVQGVVTKNAPPKGMLSMWVDRKAAGAETL